MVFLFKLCSGNLTPFPIIARNGTTKRKITIDPPKKVPAKISGTRLMAEFTPMKISGIEVLSPRTKNEMEKAESLRRWASPEMFETMSFEESQINKNAKIIRMRLINNIGSVFNYFNHVDLIIIRS